ncbi:hypothetical protein TR2A62_2651 [Thalassobium sp. R2A62]|nr:hypothetical protein TR2A62_2651 [Thalassobium sp. R2A62]
MKQLFSGQIHRAYSYFSRALCSGQPLGASGHEYVTTIAMGRVCRHNGATP